MPPTLRKAVIPAAGFGTRMFPVTKVVKKVFLPIVGQDGIARPAILVIAEEVFAAGIEEIVIVIQPEDEEDFQALFRAQVPDENYQKLSPDFRAYADQIVDIGSRISFAFQHEQEGFGHAVYCAHEAVGDEPFLVMLGDHLYSTGNDKSCTRQIVEAYHQFGENVVGLGQAPEEELRSRGTVGGNWVEANRVLRIAEFAEKPSVDYARNHLQIPGLPPDHYLTIFGNYVVQPEILNRLESNITHNRRERGEFQFTSALEQLRQDDDFYGLVIDGETFDIGQPDYYLETLKTLRG